ncbi:hypothetical protein PVL29_022698 [Vitis rotundifolia]|uniref:Uncharacterized protein n=1 Tax=Vitis rotundifolia TaxID=103349 RepID=A0AA39DAH2_VITRO|nr:hypothetical protein PVL29_022698 [Vitis rotundifolia]
MDPNPKTFPVLSYVMSRLPKLGSKLPASDSSQIDIESGDVGASTSATDGSGELVDQMPHLSHPKILASMTLAISDVAQTRSVLQTLGERPDHEAVDKAKAKIAEIDSRLSKQLEGIVLSPRPSSIERLQFRAHQAEKEQECRQAAEKEKQIYKAVVQLDEMHEAYEKLLKEAEERLVKLYESASAFADDVEYLPMKEETNEEVVGVLQEASGKGLERVDLSGRRLRFLPEAFGKIRSLVAFNLSCNQLQFIPDSIAALENLEELNLSSNLLELLPDSIGLLVNLKILDACGNKLVVLPDSICHCRSLVELDVSFNNLTYLPTNIGYELVNLKRLSINLNKIRSLPTSIGEMRSLCHLDAHFNELRGLPFAIGRLTNLETLNLSSNFSDLTELPETIGDLTNLRELDLSNNQIQALPDTFGRLDNLNKLNLDQNPLVFMAKRWLEILVEEEQKSLLEVKEQTQTGWLTRSTSWLSSVVSGVSQSVSGYLGPGPRDPFLDQQL